MQIVIPQYYGFIFDRINVALGEIREFFKKQQQQKILLTLKINLIASYDYAFSVYRKL